MGAKRTQKESRLLAALCYPVWPLALVVLLLDKDDVFVRYSAINGLGFALGVFLLSLPVALLGMIPILGTLVVLAFWICAIALAVWYAVRAYDGERVDVPFVTDLLKKNVKKFP